MHSQHAERIVRRDAGRRAERETGGGARGYQPPLSPRQFGKSPADGVSEFLHDHKMMGRALYRLAHGIAHRAVAVYGTGRTTIDDRFNAEVPIDGHVVVLQWFCLAQQSSVQGNPFSNRRYDPAPKPDMDTSPVTQVPILGCRTRIYPPRCLAIVVAGELETSVTLGGDLLAQGDVFIKAAVTSACKPASCRGCWPRHTRNRRAASALPRPFPGCARPMRIALRRSPRRGSTPLPRDGRSWP